jgi:hypothetical protein
MADCKICTRLEEAVAGTQEPENPERLLLINEATLRIHTRQRNDLIAEAQTQLEPDRERCPDQLNSPAF